MLGFSQSHMHDLFAFVEFRLYPVERLGNSGRSWQYRRTVSFPYPYNLRLFIYYQNVRGLGSKVSEISNGYEYLVIALTQTWLNTKDTIAIVYAWLMNTSFQNNGILPDIYQVFHYDSSFFDWLCEKWRCLTALRPWSLITFLSFDQNAVLWTLDSCGENCVLYASVICICCSCLFST